MEQKKMNININPNDLEDVKCVCGGMLFEQAIRIKKLSFLNSPTGQNEYPSLPVLVCKACGTELNPTELK